MGGAGFPPEMRPGCLDVYKPLESFEILRGTSPRIKCEWFERIYTIVS